MLLVGDKIQMLKRSAERPYIAQPNRNGGISNTIKGNYTIGYILANVKTKALKFNSSICCRGYTNLPHFRVSKSWFAI